MPYSFRNHLVESLTRIRRPDVPLRVAIRNTAAVVLPLGIGMATGHTAIGLGIGAGALDTMFSDQPGPYRQRIARLLLASLWARRGLHHDALHVLHGWARLDQNDPAHEDPRIGQLITAIMITTGKDSAAARRAGQLHHDHGFEPTVSRWLEMIEAPGVTDAPHATIEHMASQLVERPEVIGSLVMAQKYDPDETEIHLLRRSISRASRDLSQDSLVICQAMAELAWRWSLVLTVPIMCLAAVPLSRVNPRQGRFLRMIPAVLGYMLYVGLLLTMRSWIAEVPGSDRPWYYSMVWIHLIAGFAVFMLYFGDRLKPRRARA